MATLVNSQPRSERRNIFPYFPHDVKRAQATIMSLQRNLAMRRGMLRSERHSARFGEFGVRRLVAAIFAMDVEAQKQGARHLAGGD